MTPKEIEGKMHDVQISSLEIERKHDIGKRLVGIYISSLKDPSVTKAGENFFVVKD